LREISALVRREGPLSPQQAVSFVRRAARAASGAQDTGKRSRADSRNLVFSLGVMLFVALTGLAPRDAHLGNDLSSPPAPSAFSPYAVNASLDAIVRTCLANEPDDRFSSAAELNVALSSLAIGEHVALDYRASRG
jgi:serine/threonine protein kinase